MVQQNEGKKEPTPHEQRMYCVNVWTLAVLVLYAAFTLYAACATRDAADAAKLSADAASEASRAASAQVRAFEAVEGASIRLTRPQGGVEDGYVKLQMINHGRVTSTQTSLVVQLYRWPIEPIIIAQTHKFGGDLLEIAPGLPPEEQRTFRVPLDLSLEEPRKLESGAERLVIIADLRYDNGFGTMRTPQTCFMYPADGHSHRWSWTECDPETEAAFGMWTSDPKRSALQMRMIAPPPIVPPERPR